MSSASTLLPLPTPASSHDDHNDDVLATTCATNRAALHDIHAAFSHGTSSPHALPSLHCRVARITTLSLSLHTFIRDATCSTQRFVSSMQRLLSLLCDEAAEDVPFDSCPVRTPTEQVFAGISLLHEQQQQQNASHTPLHPSVFAVLILRAACAFEPALHRTFGDGLRIGHLLIQRQEANDGEGHVPSHKVVTHQCIWQKLPSIDPVLPPRRVYVCDVMLATGLSMSIAIEKLLQSGVPLDSIRVIVLIAVKEGITLLCQRYPQVHVLIGMIDERLNERAYILPGIGDAGDRMYSDW